MVVAYTTIPAFDPQGYKNRVLLTKLRCAVCKGQLFKYMTGTVVRPTRDIVHNGPCLDLYELNPLAYEKLGNPISLQDYYMGI